MIAAILLAAGESTRMGEPKALLPWGGTSLIEYQVRQLSEAGVDEIVVVLGHAADGIRAKVPDIARVVVNLQYREGRATSLRAGAGSLPDNVGPIVVLNVDQPRPAELLRSLLAAHEAGASPITRPAFEERHGHPPVLDGALLDELRAVEEALFGLRGVMTAHANDVIDIDLEDERVLVSFNTPEEYEEAVAKFGQP
ncbi:MAG: nucleotidyltransferase family protein [Chloroflexi bacterium]|nr:nucleotidyltransferase family protein [Chloroflexota bacterium]